MKRSHSFLYLFVSLLVFMKVIASIVDVEGFFLQKNLQLIIERSELIFVDPASKYDPLLDYHYLDSNLAQS